MEEENHQAATGVGIFGLIILILVGWWAYNSFIKSETWTAYYYPTAGSDNYLTETGFNNIDQCRDWVNARGAKDPENDWDYECGVNCTFRSEYGETICETSKR